MGPFPFSCHYLPFSHTFYHRKRVLNLLRNVLDLLVSESYNVIGLVRRPEHAKGIEASGAKAVLGDLHDHDLIAKHTYENDITLHTATADDLPSVKAVLEGVRRRTNEGKRVVFGTLAVNSDLVVKDLCS